MDLIFTLSSTINTLRAEFIPTSPDGRTNFLWLVYSFGCKCTIGNSAYFLIGVFLYGKNHKIPPKDPKKLSSV